MSSGQPGQPAWIASPAGERILVVQGADAAAHILRRNPNNYRKNFAGFGPVFGESRLTADGETWRRLRHLTQPFIAALDPDGIAAATRRHFSAATDRMLAAAEDRVVRIDPILDRATAGVAMEMLFGRGQWPFPNDSFDDLGFVLSYSGTASWEEGRRGRNRLAATAAGAALARWRSAVAALLAERPVVGSELLATIADATPDDRDRIGEFTTLLFAGSDTSAAALSWALWLLAANPDLQSRLRAAAGRRPLTVASAGDVPELLSFVSEVLRLYPPVPVLSRIADEPDRIGDMDIVRGQKVLLSIIGLHRDPLVWREPSTLDPTRFHAGGPSADQRPHFMPFSTGPRVCGGMAFAMVELPVAIMTVLSRVRLSRADDDEPIIYEWSPTLRRGGGQEVTVEPL